MTLDPSGRLAYTAVVGATYAFTVNGQTGALTAIPGSHCGPASAGSVVIDPAGRFAYVLSNVVYALAIDPSSGALTAVPRSPFSITAGSMLIDPTGQFACVLKTGPGRQRHRPFDRPRGRAHIGRRRARDDTCPADLAHHRPERAIRVRGCRYGSGTAAGIYALTRNAVTSVLTAVAGSPFAVSSVPNPAYAVTVTN